VPDDWSLQVRLEKGRPSPFYTESWACLGDEAR